MNVTSNKNATTKTILIVAAHADDEVLGCGGTIARHVGEGDTVHAVYLADGVSSRPGAEQSALAGRMAACESARNVLGIASTTFLGLPDNRLDSLPLIDVIQPLEALLQRLAPHTVYTHHHGDLNVDHRIAHQAVMTACRPSPGCPVKQILAFEIMSSTEWATPGVEPFLANHYVDITEYLPAKLEALKAYQSEMRDAPHSRSIQHLEQLAKHRGHCVGVDAAEAFVAVRALR